ncbi:MAG TPA: class I SAM-dependent methyltransferase [Burkholderiales bacterium]|nr:class I SAM-dependent methyltransferase [Burkholderiales bacterium]
MGLYYRYIFPRLLDLSMRNPEVKRYREQLVPQAKGCVLEIGIGSGLNLPFYGPQVEHLYGLEPCPELRQMARQRAGRAQRDVELLNGTAEQIPLANQTVDNVVSTWTMCSVADVDRALREVRRVLRPGGELLFVEHGLAPDAAVSAWQRRLTPLWSRCAGGCHLDCKIDALIADAGFRLDELHTEYAKGPKLMAYMYLGHARPA